MRRAGVQPAAGRARARAAAAGEIARAGDQSEAVRSALSSTTTQSLPSAFAR